MPAAINKLMPPSIGMVGSGGGGGGSCANAILDIATINSTRHTVRIEIKVDFILIIVEVIRFVYLVKIIFLET